MRTRSGKIIPVSSPAKKCPVRPQLDAGGKKPRESPPSSGGSADWSVLPDELLELILQHLREVSDYVRFSAVCRRWSRIYTEKRDSLALDQPWIWDRQRWGNGFYCLSEKRWYGPLNLPRFLADWDCCGSQHGWLIFVPNYTTESACRCTALLVNPFSGAQIQLPENNSLSYVVTCMLDKFCCSLPPDDARCIVVYMQCVGGKMGIWSRKSKWVNYRKPYPDGYASAIFYKGSLYAATFRGELCIVDLASHEPDGRFALRTIFSRPNINMCSQNLTLIEHRGELLLLCLDINQRSLSALIFEVFKANIELSRWEASGTWQVEKHSASEGFDLMPILKNQIENPSEIELEIRSKIVLYHCMRQFESAMLSPRPW